MHCFVRLVVAGFTALLSADSFAAGSDEPACNRPITSDPEAAAKRFEEGRRAFAQGKTEEAYRAFLEAFEEDRCPAAYAANLGTVELVLGHYRDAAEHFARALSLRTREGSPLEYATAQFSRGQAFLRLAGAVRGPRDLSSRKGFSRS